MTVDAGQKEPDPLGGTPRLVFANQLRGLAAVSVVASHLLAVFWYSRDFVGVATATPVQPGAIPGFVGITANPWFMPGPFGVALFFLISGLVIPFSLERHRTGRFLLARALRIWPTYLAVLLIEIVTLHLNSWYWGRSFPYSIAAQLANAALLHELLARPSIDLVNWTLCIELSFYLLVATVAPLLRRGVPWLPLAMAVGLLGLALLLRAIPVGAPLDAVWQTLRMEVPYLVFMCIGTMFTLRLRGRLPWFGLLCAIPFLLAVFALSWKIGPQAGQYPIVLYNYGYAVLLFSACFLLRRLIRPFWLFDRLADISYPLYLLHLIVGISIMKLTLLRFGWSAGYSLIAALTVATALAMLLHRTIERPSIAAGRALAEPRRGIITQ